MRVLTVCGKVMVTSSGCWGVRVGRCSVGKAGALPVWSLVTGLWQADLEAESSG